jgi:integrase
MASKSITIKGVQALKPHETIWDAGHNEVVKGFGVRRQVGDPVYVIKYRVFGRQRFVTIGRHGAPWTPETARREAKRLFGLIAAGKDPQIEKTIAKENGSFTLRKIADQYLRYAEKKQKPRSFAETKRHLNKNWKPLHKTSIFDIQRRHVAVRLGQIEKERGQVTAARSRAALSALFNWAIREGFELPSNPVTGTNKPPEPKSRQRVLSDNDLAEILNTVVDDDYGKIVKLLALTGQRREEVGGMRWSEIDQDKKLWTIPPFRTKNRREHLVPLPNEALAIIETIPRNADRNFLFGSGPRKAGDKERGFSGWSKAKTELDQKILERRRSANPEATPLPWVLHDLRRTCATMLADRFHTPPHIVEAILNHVSGHKAGVAGVYNRAKYLSEIQKSLGVWALHIGNLLKG